MQQCRMLKHGLSIYTYYFGPTTQKYLLHIKLTILYTQDNTSLEMAFKCLQDFFHQGMLFMMWFHNKLIKVSKKNFLRLHLSTKQ